MITFRIKRPRLAMDHDEMRMKIVENEVQLGRNRLRNEKAEHDKKMEILQLKLDFLSKKIANANACQDLKNL